MSNIQWRPVKNYPGYLISNNQNIMTICGRPVPCVNGYVSLFNAISGELVRTLLHDLYKDSILADMDASNKSWKCSGGFALPIGYRNGELIFPDTLELVYDRDNN